MSLKQKLYCRTLCCKMAYTVKAILRTLDERFTEEGIDLTLEQYFLLNILDNEEGLILQDLADIVDRDKSAVLRHIDNLEQSHYVARTTDADDKRKKILIITKPGMKVLEQAKALDKKVNSEVTRHIDKEKLEELEEMLSGMYEQALSVGDH